MEREFDLDLQIEKGKDQHEFADCRRTWKLTRNRSRICRLEGTENLTWMLTSSGSGSRMEVKRRPYGEGIRS
jgi:hypothetical protein